MYNLLRIVIIIVSHLPRQYVQALGSVTGFVAWLVARRARKQATLNMIHVLGKEVVATPTGRKKLRRTVQGMFQNSACNYLQVVSLPQTQPEIIVHSMQIEGQEYLDAALAQGKGVLLFSAHFGPFDYLCQWIAIKGYALTIPVERLRDERMLTLMLNLRRSRGVNFIPLGGSSPMRAIFQALRNNQIVLITADRAVQGESIEVPFFAAPAHLPLGPVALAQRTGALLIGAFGWRTYSTPPIQGRFIPLSLKLPEEQRADTMSLMSGIVEVMEQVIRKHPEQWVVFSPIWKNC